MPIAEFDQLGTQDLRALMAAIRAEDAAKVKREAGYLAMFANAHFKRSTGGNFEIEDFLPIDMQEETAEQKLESRVATLRASISRGPNVTNGPSEDKTPTDGEHTVTG